MGESLVSAHVSESPACISAADSGLGKGRAFRPEGWQRLTGRRGGRTGSYPLGSSGAHCPFSSLNSVRLCCDGIAATMRRRRADCAVSVAI